MVKLFNYMGHREIHWLKIDAERSESEIIGGWGASEKRPWIIVIENKIPNSKVSINDQLEKMILQRHYDYGRFEK